MKYSKYIFCFLLFACSTSEDKNEVKQQKTSDIENSSERTMVNDFNIDSIQDKVYPRIKVILPDDDNSLDVSETDRPIFQKWHGDLAIFYVVDEGNYFSFILNRQLNDKWTIEKVHEIAMRNLKRDTEFNLSEAPTFGGYALIAGGDHEPTGLLIPEMWDDISKTANSNLIVSAPAKDLLLIAPASDKSKIDNLKALMTKVFASGEGLLSKKLFEYKRGTKQWTVCDSIP
jgi:uncharacterized protein YtpQ (UPF0354 family)